jgi:hypothetical protein
MKKSLFLYLFILAVLMNIFTYMYFSKRTNFEETHSATAIKKYKDSLGAIGNRLSDADYFSLENNQNAQTYFDNVKIKSYPTYHDLAEEVKAKLIAFNDNPAGNPYTGQVQLGTQKFIINKAKVLNHRWIIAEYSDGTYWGEVLLKYFMNEDDTVSFEIIQSVIYQKQTE